MGSLVQVRSANNESSHSMSAANVYFLSGYPSGLIRSKENYNVSDIFGTADSAERNCRQYLSLEL